MKKKFTYLLLVLILILFIVFALYYFKGNDNKEPTQIKIVDNIEKYGYNLYENKTDLYKNKFNELKEVLNKEEIDEKKYSEILAELFVIDFYDLNSKVTNTDVGGLDFIFEDVKEEFNLAAEDTLYKYIESDVYGERTQELPNVTKTQVTASTTISFESERVSDENAYEVEVEISYSKDLGYPTKVNITLVHCDNKLCIVEVK